MVDEGGPGMPTQPQRGAWEEAAREIEKETREQAEERIQELYQQLFDVETNRLLAEMRLNLLQSQGASEETEMPENLTPAQAALWHLQNNLPGILERAKERKIALLSELVGYIEHIQEQNPGYNFTEQLADIPDKELHSQLLKDIETFKGHLVSGEENMALFPVLRKIAEADPSIPEDYSMESLKESVQRLSDEELAELKAGYDKYSAPGVEKSPANEVLTRHYSAYPDYVQAREILAQEKLLRPGSTNYADREPGKVNPEAMRARKWVRRMPIRLAARKRDLQQKMVEAGFGNIGPRIWSRSWMVLKDLAEKKERRPKLEKVSEYLNATTVLGLLALAALSSRTFREHFTSITGIGAEPSISPEQLEEVRPEIVPEQKVSPKSEVIPDRPDTKIENDTLPERIEKPSPRFGQFVFQAGGEHGDIGTRGFYGLVESPEFKEVKIDTLSNFKKERALQQLAKVLHEVFSADPESWQKFAPGAKRPGLFLSSGYLDLNVLVDPKVLSAVDAKIAEGSLNETKLLANHMPSGGFRELMESSLRK